MTFKDRNFNHDEDNFHLALGVSDETKNICRERIFFAIFSNSLQADELFDDVDDIPKEFRTVTGDLQRLLSMITNPVEYEYTLLTFMMYQRMAKEVYSVYRNTNVENAESREERIKMEIIRSIMKLKELKDREESGLEADEDDVEVFTKESIMQRIGLVKKSGYNFDKYLLLVRNDNNTTSSKQKGSDFDINDLLSGLFSKDDE
jgi:hypothetical protein